MFLSLWQRGLVCEFRTSCVRGLRVFDIHFAPASQQADGNFHEVDPTGGRCQAHKKATGGFNDHCKGLL